MMEEIKAQIEELQNLTEQQNESIKKLVEEGKLKDEKIQELKDDFSKHQHNFRDGTLPIEEGIRIKQGEPTYFGNGGIAQLSTIEPTVQHGLYIAAGTDTGIASGAAVHTTNTQLDILNQINDGFIQSSSFIYTNNNKSISSGSSTITDDFFKWTTNELAGRYINIYNSSKTFVITRKVVSNTSTVITVDSNWGSSLSGVTYEVFQPTYLGSAAYPWRRLYTGEGSSEGLRFGYGPTAGGQNGMLYMDATGDLYWRNKAGTSTKLN